ncbi:MAG: hypothetical protein HQ516_07750 [Chlorobium sp.]|uniref:Uncharacterized protein n=2 Tax=Chlorobium phaeovibrioides TaxID=1094 RepID=A0ABW9UTX7_CHLPH|nr:hypothetical protein [Chlorobium phaeovibrioides]MWV55184.1 hypothetical protein [Chlorobium phaeovibrioides]NQU46924.1 hypothetical protein [Chlorobium sp.]HCD36764.1 hypothetical protein [Chlorobium sp.]
MIIARLQSRSGTNTDVTFDPGRLQPLAAEGNVDAYIVSTENGFSPLGLNLDFLVRDLRVPNSRIRELADWNRFQNPRVTLVAIPSQRSGSLLRGVILAPAQSSKCYGQFVTSSYYSRPYRDFYYNVTYDAIACASLKWGARNLAVSHLSAPLRFSEDIATCNAEALAHFCDEHDGMIESFTFLGCCMYEGHFKGITRLNLEGDVSRHRQIRIEEEQQEDHILLHLDWSIA